MIIEVIITQQSAETFENPQQQPEFYQIHPSVKLTYKPRGIHLQEFHDRNRVEEVKSTKQLGPSGRHRDVLY